MLCGRMFAELQSSSLLRKQLALLMYGVPTWFLTFVQIGLAFITLIFAGTMGEDMLAGVGLGNTMYNVMLWSVLWGFTSALDTFGPQVYACSDKKGQLGTVTLKIMLQGLLIYIFILGLFLNSTHLIMLLPTDNDIQMSRVNNTGYNSSNSTTIPTFSSFQTLTELEITVTYMRLVCLVPLLDFFVSIISKYLMIQKYIVEVYVISVAMVLLHVIWNLILVTWAGWGVQGLAYSAVLTRLVTLFPLLIYCWLRRKDLDYNSEYSREVYRNWEETIKLGLSGAANLSVEMGMFEIATFLSQFNGTTSLATLVIIFQINTCCYTVPIGISVATTILIGKALGERDTAEVKSYMQLAIVNTLADSVVLSVMFYFLRYPLARLFTSTPEVIDMFTGCVWIFLIQMPFDHLQTVLSRGILISFGKQRFIALSLSLICYLVATPLIAVFIFFTSLGPLGILIAFLVFAVLNTVAGAVKIWSLSLDEEVKRAEGRATDSPFSSSNSTDDLIAGSSNVSLVLDETTPLTGRKGLEMNGRNVAILFCGGIVVLAVLVFTSML